MKRTAAVRRQQASFQFGTTVAFCIRRLDLATRGMKEVGIGERRVKNYFPSMRNLLRDWVAFLSVALVSGATSRWGGSYARGLTVPYCIVWAIPLGAAPV